MLLRLALSSSILAVAAAAIVPPGQAAAGRLIGTVGPGFDITLTHSGKPVTRLRAGTCTLVVRDRSRIHDYQRMS